MNERTFQSMNLSFIAWLTDRLHFIDRHPDELFPHVVGHRQFGAIGSQQVVDRLVVDLHERRRVAYLPIHFSFLT